MPDRTDFRVETLRLAQLAFGLGLIAARARQAGAGLDDLGPEEALVGADGFHG